LQKEFVWSDEAQQAFEKLKSAMVTTPVLALPQFDLPFIVETDACEEGLGAVLMQGDHPIAYISKALGVRNKQRSIYEKEFLALIMAVDRWRPYLQRSEFFIRTDHKSLSFLGDQQLHTDLQRKAMAKLMGLQFKIIYKKGKENVVADALSRVGHLMTISTVTEVQPLWIQEVLNSYATGPATQKLLAKLCLHSLDKQGYWAHQGVIRRHNLIWIGVNSTLQMKLIAALHDGATGGHSGI
jgi:hypothetical protein